VKPGLVVVVAPVVLLLSLLLQHQTLLPHRQHCCLWQWG
jgi:hypothetical protein